MPPQAHDLYDRQIRTEGELVLKLIHMPTRVVSCKNTLQPAATFVRFEFRGKVINQLQFDTYGAAKSTFEHYKRVLGIT